MQAHGPRERLLRFFAAALHAVHGRKRVRERLSRRPEYDHVIAIGKAGASMLEGARDALGNRLAAGLVITKYGHTSPQLHTDPRLTLIESGHPIPDENSLAAGAALLRFLAAAPPSARLLFLISGGASALVEQLPPGVTPDAWQRANAWLLASGLPIDAINRVRGALSLIKAGRLLSHVGRRECLGLLISDVPGDDPAAIGSGLLVPQASGDLPPGLPDWLSMLARSAPSIPVEPAVPLELIATNADARAAACAAARVDGRAAFDHGEGLRGDLFATADEIARQLDRLPPGVHVWGGETSVCLPAAPGRGGRNQSLALALAARIAGRDDLFVLAAGTDGSDGPTEDAGALVDGGTLRRGQTEGLDAHEALRTADAGSFLAAAGDLIDTGPTGTNVMDLLLIERLPSPPPAAMK